MGPPKEVFSVDPPQPVVVNAIAKIIAEMDTDRIRDCIVTTAPFQNVTDPPPPESLYILT